MANSGNAHRDQVIDGMLKVLQDYLPQSVAGLPSPSVSLTSVSERAVGLNNRIGTEKRGEFPIIAVKGIRLDALVRFQGWASNPTQIDTDFIHLNSQLLADRDSLRKVGFLRLALENTLSAENVSSPNAWHKQADYRILYESQFQDSDGALGLIANIPITSFLEQPDSFPKEITTVTDRMLCWNTTTAPQLVVRGPFAVGSLNALAFFPNPGNEPTGRVTLTRTFDGAQGPPNAYSAWDKFLAAVSGPHPQERHSQVTFASLKDFLGNFKSAGDPVAFGELGATNPPDIYNALVLAINPAIQLPGVIDRLELTYQNKAFDQAAILYLRATGG